MELIFIFIHVVAELDKLFQKPLRRIVPNVDEFLADPAAYFRYQEITIHPWRRWIMITGFGFIGGPLLFVMCGGLLVALFEPKNVGRPRPLAQIFFMAGLIVVVIGGSWLASVLWRGGTCILGAAGVRFVRDNTEVFCPWSLFATPGQPVVHPIQGRNRLELPIAAHAIPLVEARRNDIVIAQGLDVKTAQLRFRSPQELVLQNYYQLSPQELGGLLLRLGRTLAGPPKTKPFSPAFANPELASSARATRQADGWITVSLTGLVLPPECCSCLTPTANTQCFFDCRKLKGADVSIFVPICPSCQREFRQRYRKAFCKVALIIEAIAASGGFLAGALFALLDRAPNMLLVWAPMFAIMAAIGGLCFVWLFRGWATKWALPPVEIRHYDPKEGTVSVRFRGVGYAERMCQAMQT